MRPSWDRYFLYIAKIVSTRSTCPRAHVGAVIVQDRRILATGYNGSIPSHPHCDDIGCDMVGGHCVRTIHAEANAIAQCAIYGVGINERTMLYTTLNPCDMCVNQISEFGIHTSNIIVEERNP